MMADGTPQLTPFQQSYQSTLQTLGVNPQAPLGGMAAPAGAPAPKGITVKADQLTDIKPMSREQWQGSLTSSLENQIRSQGVATAKAGAEAPVEGSQQGWLPWLAERGVEIGGYGVGTTLGAMVGGPAGAIAGGTFGGVAGDYLSQYIEHLSQGTPVDTSAKHLAYETGTNLIGTLGFEVAGKFLGPVLSKILGKGGVEAGLEKAIGTGLEGQKAFTEGLTAEQIKAQSKIASAEEARLAATEPACASSATGFRVIAGPSSSARSSAAKAC